MQKDPHTHRNPKHNPAMKRFFSHLAALLLMWPLCAAAQPSVRVASGPYLQAVGEREFTVVWTTNIDAVAWVEVAPDDGTHFYNTERPKYYQVLNGRRPIGRLHAVKVSGLEPATTYRYRIMQNGVLVNEGHRRVIFGEGFGSNVHRREPYEVTTLDRSKSSVAFSIVNDMHEHDSILRVLYKDVKPGRYDFVCFNGDMTSSIDSQSGLFDNYLASSAELFAATTPLYVARGNHENRGTFAMEWMNYFPSATGRPYFAFRQGPAYFIVLDGGEDKPDSDIENMDLMRSDDFRAEEAEWLASVVEQPDFKSAPVRIVVCHMPPSPDGWHGGAEVARLFVPILNRAGIDLMLSGHIHRYKLWNKGENGCDFPVLCNPNQMRMDVTADAHRIDVRIYDASGALKHNDQFTK